MQLSVSEVCVVLAMLGFFHVVLETRTELCLVV